MAGQKPLFFMQQNVHHITERLEQELNATLLLIKEEQLPSGEFQTFEHYPTLHPGHWIKGPSSPFVTASILAALADINHPTAKIVLDKGASFIEHTEEDGLWRFWKNNASENNVPCDADDTGICAFALKRVKGTSINNQHLFAANRNADGLFYTWFMPRFSFIGKPLRLIGFINDTKLAKTTIEKGFLDKEDVEIAVMANVLLYLGQTSITQKAIAFTINTLKAKTGYPMHFYSTEVFVWYHIARAYHYSVPSLGDLSADFVTYFKIAESKIDLKTDLALALVLFNSACYFKEYKMAENLLSRLLDATSQLPHYPYPYFTSKNRIYNAGAAALTLSWYAGFLQNAYNHYKQPSG